MKTNKFKLSFYFLFVGFVLLSLSSCSTNVSKSYQTTECSILIDVTSSYMASLKHISSDELIKLYQLDTKTSNAGIYRQAFLTETFLNYTYQYNLKGVSSFLMSNSFDREEEIKIFKEKIATSIAEIQQVKKNRPSSSVYVPICRELIRLSSSDSERKILLAYTDLKENSDYLSFFSKKSLGDLVNHPEKIENYLQREMELPKDLTGIEMFIIHEPEDNDNFIFKRLSRIYKTMIEKRGGKVYIQANLLL